MSNFSKNNNTNDLDNYDAEIVEDIPEQFDLSRYRKQQKSMDSNRILTNAPTSALTTATTATTNTTSIDTNSPSFLVRTIPQTQKYKNGDTLLEGRYIYTAPNMQEQYNYINFNTKNRQEIIGDKNFLPPLQYSGMNQQTMIKTRPNYQHQLPFISGSPLIPSGIIQAPIPQYPNQQQQSYGGSGIENYGVILQSTYQTGNHGFETQNNDFKKKTQSKTIDDSYRDDAVDEDDETYTYISSRRNKGKNEGNPKSPSFTHFKKDQPSEFYTKEPQYQKKVTQVSDTSPESDSGSYYSEEIIPSKNFNSKNSELTNYRGTSTGFNIDNSSSNNNLDSSYALKSNLKSSVKKHGVKFDEKLEVYEVNNPHYGSEAKSEKREMKRKKKDKKKEDEMLLKTKLDIKSKLQTQKSVLYHVSF